MSGEQLIKDQIKGMEGWAIRAREDVLLRKFDEAKNGLKKINTQGRRLEWRGGERGLKHLPKLEEVKVLKLKISETRAAAQESISGVERLSKLAKKEGKTPAEMSAIKKKEGSYLKEAGKAIVICIQLLKEARVIAYAEPWFDPKLLSRPENRKFLLMMIQKKGFYGSIDQEFLARTISEVNFHHLSKYGVGFPRDLEGVFLAGADLSGMDFSKNINLKKANLTKANLFKTNFRGADLEGANLEGANLAEANIQLANLKKAVLKGANLRYTHIIASNFNHSDLRNADLTYADIKTTPFFRADIEGANFEKVILDGWTRAEGFRYVQNAEKARNFPAGINL